jgi:hypothetical protein
MNDSWGDGWNGAMLDVVYNGASVTGPVTLPDGVSGSINFGINDSSCNDTLVVFGCTDWYAINYNPLATIDDGSCYYDTDSTYCEASFEIATVVVDSNLVVLMNTSIGDNLNYFWDFGDGNTSTDQYPFHTYTDDGTYMICLSVFDNVSCQDIYCDTITYINPPVQGGGDGFFGFHINVVPPTATSIDELGLSDADVQLFPNPAEDILYLTVDAEMTKGLSMEVFDMSGRLVHTNRISGPQTTIDVSQFSEGMYILNLVGENGQLTRRFNVLK